MRGLAFVIVLVVTAGCPRDNTVPCGALRCPAGFSCTADRCVHPEQLASCAGALDGTECRYPGVTGACTSGVCWPPSCGDARKDDAEACDEGSANSDDADAECRLDCTARRCGDGIVDRDHGEACDDGNLAAGDGCVPDCSSDESCGNGVVDYSAGEQCDDQNVRVHDGCSGCRYEATTAQLASAVPLGRQRAAVAYDIARDRMVVFGGSAVGTRLSDTWELFHDTWRRMKPVTQPPAMRGAAMVYDVARERVVLFGGNGLAGNLGETWLWDGANWSKPELAVQPAPRADHAMAYDPVRRRVVLFGGSGSTQLTDTWEWDGSTWTMRAPATPPPTTTFTGTIVMAYDIARARMVMHRTNTNSAETWLWDGMDWSLASTNAPPIAAVAGAYDHDLQQVVVVGVTIDGDTLTIGWDGAGWTMLNVNDPGTSYSSIMAWDSRRHRLLLFGGLTPLTAVESSTLSALVAGAWEVVTLTEPPPRRNASAAYDPAHGATVVMGGKSDSSFLADTWIWTGGTWTRAVDGPQRSHASATYDPDQRVVVVWGGRNGTGAIDTGAVFDGSSWVALTEGSMRPLPRSNHRIAYDRARHQLVLFGGGAAFVPTLADTWLWSNGTWTPVTTMPSPSARHSHVLAFDPIARATVLQGGGTTSATQAKLTWSWNGMGWTEAAPGPSARRGHAMVFDDAVGRLVVVGVSPTTGGLDLWELGADGWIERDLTMLPARYRSTVTYDTIRGELVIVGGTSYGGNPFGGVGATVSGTLLIGRHANVAIEACIGASSDYDDDGMFGCADPDCRPVCDPLCLDGSATCDPARPRCGDATCNGMEDCRLCPGDCGACAGECGDGWCDPSETSCAADC